MNKEQALKFCQQFIDSSYYQQDKDSFMELKEYIEKSAPPNNYRPPKQDRLEITIAMNYQPIE